MTLSRCRRNTSPEVQNSDAHLHVLSTTQIPVVTSTRLAPLLGAAMHFSLPKAPKNTALMTILWRQFRHLRNVYTSKTACEPRSQLHITRMLEPLESPKMSAAAAIQPTGHEKCRKTELLEWATSRGEHLQRIPSTVKRSNQPEVASSFSKQPTRVTDHCAAHTRSCQACLNCPSNDAPNMLPAEFVLPSKRKGYYSSRSLIWYA